MSKAAQSTPNSLQWNRQTSWLPTVYSCLFECKALDVWCMHFSSYKNLLRSPAIGVEEFPLLQCGAPSAHISYPSIYSRAFVSDPSSETAAVSVLWRGFFFVCNATLSDFSRSSCISTGMCSNMVRWLTACAVCCLTGSASCWGRRGAKVRVM